MAVVQEIKVPLLAVNDTTLTVVEINFANGAAVKAGDQLMVFETSKTTYEVVADASGFVQYFCEVGNDYEVNQVVAKVFELSTELEATHQPAKVNATAAPIVISPAMPAANAISWEGPTIFSDAAASLLAAAGADASLFKGRDFVSRADAEAVLGIQTASAASNGHAARPAPAPSKTVATPVVSNEKWVVEKLTSGKKREINYLADIQSTGLTSTINTLVETGGIFVHLNESLRYLKNSLLPLLVYETARLLKKYPVLNAYYTPEGIAFYKEVNVGFAIDIDKGLKVLRLPATNEKTLAAIEESILSLSEKYLDDKLQIEDLTDISFTITDLSAEAVHFFRPLVNTMNSAILGLSSIDEKLERCIISLSFDHRVTEGKQVALFLKELKTRLESYRADASYKTSSIACFKCFTTLAEDITDVGFAACIQPDGQPGYICQRCFKGF
ncbi:MAG TPA: 2-oxo acid dehydrogenase subunit E2 [Chitinophagaceae bacterium]|nr:2-oxo acid dehydrogenase subunit E2 [Chitinophagaceae bacterium]